MSTPLATKPKTKLTPHQLEVLKIVIVGNESEDPTLRAADLDEILERITKTTTKAAMQFTIRALVQNGMILKADRVSRRGRIRITFLATPQGRAVGGEKPAAKPAGLVEPAHVTALEDLLSGT